MAKRMLATVIYNIVLWGIFISFANKWGSEIILLYLTCMPVFFGVIYNKIAGLETIDPDNETVLQFIIGCVLSAFFAFIAIMCISSDEGIIPFLAIFVNLPLFAVVTSISAFRARRDWKIGVLATLVYNAVLWIIFVWAMYYIPFRLDFEMMIAYAIIMTALFYPICNKMTDLKTAETSQIILQLFSHAAVSNFFTCIMFIFMETSADSMGDYRVFALCCIGTFLAATIMNALYFIIYKRKG